MTCLLAVQDANLVSSDFLISAKDRSDLSFSVTENGFAVKDENAMPIEEALQDEPPRAVLSRCHRLAHQGRRRGQGRRPCLLRLEYVLSTFLLLVELALIRSRCRFVG